MIDGFDRFQTALYQIKQLLLSELKIRQLLVNDDYSPYIAGAVTIEAAKNYIFLAPVFNTNIEPYNKNTFITIILEKDDFDEDSVSHDVAVTINCFSQTVLWEIDNQKIRPLELASLITKKLNGQKLSTSHKIDYINFDSVVLNENIQGFSLGFFLRDGAGLEDKF
jgi:hypothetical protein